MDVMVSISGSSSSRWGGTDVDYRINVRVYCNVM